MKIYAAPCHPCTLKPLAQGPSKCHAKPHCTRSLLSTKVVCSIKPLNCSCSTENQLILARLYFAQAGKITANSAVVLVTHWSFPPSLINWDFAHAAMPGSPTTSWKHGCKNKQDVSRCYKASASLSCSHVIHRCGITTSHPAGSPQTPACSFCLLWGGISHTSQMALFVLPNVSLLSSHTHFHVAAALPWEALKERGQHSWTRVLQANGCSRSKATDNVSSSTQILTGLFGHRSYQTLQK